MVEFLSRNRRPILMLLAMSIGIIFYVPLAKVDAATGHTLTPALIFSILFVTFCSVDIRDLRLSPLLVVLILFQLITTPLVYYICRPMGEILAQGAMVCFMAPIAMAAVAIGSILGANIIAMVSYTLLCNVVMAFAAPIFLNLFGSGECSFEQILARVVPLLLAPLVFAQALKIIWRPAADWVASHKQMSFYMWLVSMFVTLARTTNYVVVMWNEINLTTAISLAVVALVACIIQYSTGRIIGRRYNEPITGAQSLGQKNTVLTVWLAQAFLHPVCSIAPTTYIIWQNLVNALQIYLHDKRKS